MSCLSYFLLFLLKKPHQRNQKTFTLQFRIQDKLIAIIVSPFRFIGYNHITVKKTLHYVSPTQGSALPNIFLLTDPQELSTNNFSIDKGPSILFQHLSSYKALSCDFFRLYLSFRPNLLYSNSTSNSTNFRHQYVILQMYPEFTRKKHQQKRSHLYQKFLVIPHAQVKFSSIQLQIYPQAHAYKAQLLRGRDKILDSPPCQRKEKF